MILYHGSNTAVTKPKIIINEFGKDFGFAFYLTPIKEQAERMAKRKVKFEKNGIPTVSIFSWNEKIDNLKFKKFEKPNLEWLDLIVHCRSDLEYCHGFDIVEGKIAEDSVGETVSYVVRGIIRKEDAIEKLKFQRINSQIAFCSEKALSTLSFKESYVIDDE